VFQNGVEFKKAAGKRRMRTREDIIRLARTCINTPWRHQGRLPGLGLDCIGLVNYVAHELELPGGERINDTNYGHYPDQSRVQLELAEHGDRITWPEAQPGDVILVADPVGNHSVHVGILAMDAAGQLTLIHATARNRKVVEQVIDEILEKQIRGAFRYRGIS
jgi:cell wall-associated NlpC family hydrolase